MATTCGTALADPLTRIESVPCQYLIALQKIQDIQDSVAAATEEKTCVCSVGEIAGGQSSTLILLYPPGLPMGCRAELLPWPKPSFPEGQHPGLIALLRSLEPAQAPTHNVCNLSFSPWL